jgi:hypothetical protein
VLSLLNANTSKKWISTYCTASSYLSDYSSYIMLGYFIKYLDQTNYSNAFVSGMKEDVHPISNDSNRSYNSTEMNVIYSELISISVLLSELSLPK